MTTIAVVMDLWNRKIVGYEVSTKIDTDLVIRALDKALKRSRPGIGLLFHSDRGVQFASHDFRAALRREIFT